MRCSSCDRENGADASFCNGCGARLARACSGCGRSNPPDAAFCSGCGQPLGEAAAAPTPAPPVAAPAADPTPPAAAASSPPPAPSGVSGMRFAAGRYQVQRLLGEGGKKRVYLAHDTRLGRDVAVSVLKTDGLDQSGQVRVRHEAEAMGRLGDHPNVVTVFDIGEEGDALYIVSEFMAGGDVESRLREAAGGPLAIPDAIRIVSEMCRALEHAHGHGIVHRDVKPGNVWLRQDGSAGLGDFGLALFEERSRITQEGMMVGTVMFSDMEGFTAMTERLGDEGAHRVIRAHNGILRRQVKEHGGREVDSQGDGFLVAFPSPRAGALAAVAMQRAFAAYSEEHPDEPVRIRIGLHTGQAIRDADKFFGRTVIMACRIADQARATEILVSDDVRQAVGDAFPLGEPRDLTLKGFSGTHPAHPLAWG